MIAVRARVLKVLLQALVVALPATADVVGSVSDEAGNPLVAARVCYMHGSIEIDCATTDAQGAFRLADNPLNVVRVLAEGYMPQTIKPDQAAAIRLQKSPSLFVRLVERRTGRAVGRGQIFVLYPDGKRKGPFPVNEAGVKIERLLEPGMVVIEYEAVGFESSAQPVSARLTAGRETTVEIELARLSAEAGPGS